MKIKAVKYKNFKYALPDEYITIDFTGAEAVVMGGPNGYGKTTVFDAIELLIMGKIKHFNADLPNNRKDNISVLANDDSKDISIVIDFIKQDEIITIERKFISDEDFDSKIYYNDQIIDNDKLFNILGINENLFSVGTYISQIDSLDFLQQKYKTRKETITGILDSSNIFNRLEQLKAIQSNLKLKYDEKISKDKECLESYDKERNAISEKIKALNSSQESIGYKKLFENKDYMFDKERFDENDIYDVVISPINDMIEFAKYKKSFFTKKRNKEIDEILVIDKKVYMALYFLNEIKEYKENNAIVEMANEILKLKKQFEERNFTINQKLFEKFEVSPEETTQLQLLLEQKGSLEKSVTGTQAILSNLIKERTRFIDAYNEIKNDSILPNDICPLCGRKSSELDTLFLKTEETLSQNIGVMASQLAETVKTIILFYENKLFPKTDSYLNEHKRIISNYTYLQSVLSLSTSVLQDKLNKEQIEFINKNNTVDLSEFESKFEELKAFLEKLKKDETEVISDELYEKLSRVMLEYYSDRDIYNEEVLNEKKAYISILFSSNYTSAYNKINAKFIELETQIKETEQRFESLSKNLDVVIKKYDASRKMYESSIANNISLPLYIYSGKIIQNYPLGLGVVIQVENNSIVFKTGNLKNDIFNNLSTGQLNGVVISLLLAVKDVFAPAGSLDTLLIDDPLQTIDEISAISFIDILLEHFNETQIVLSTHEEDKQFLIKKKYEQFGKKCHVINMQDRYLEI
ncbi:MAG: hypothetical protein IJA32_16170 [Lachnospiraceae bacterium]|nr:hypothetical protein [Lachnospiraceae bacterium]